MQVGSAHVKTKPHVIAGNPTLAFQWPKGERLLGQPKGTVFFFRQVNHPGSDFSKYLLKTLRKALATVRIRLD